MPQDIVTWNLAVVDREAPGPPEAATPTPERLLQPGPGFWSSKALRSARRTSAARGDAAGQGGAPCW